MSATTGTADLRDTIYARLRRRNRVVGALRLGVPAAGVLVFAIFAAQIFLANLRNQFGIGSVSFSGDTVTVETPSYSGVLDNGDVYKVAAASAQTAISNPDLIELTDATLQLTKTTGNQMTARVSHGTFATLKQVLAVPGSASVGDSAGNAGMLQNVSVNLAARTLTTDGPVSITMADGSTIEAAGLDYDATTDRWDFHGPVRLTATQPAGEDSPEPTP
jgi:hypothetical protein